MFCYFQAIDDLTSISTKIADGDISHSRLQTLIESTLIERNTRRTDTQILSTLPGGSTIKVIHARSATKYAASLIVHVLVTNVHGLRTRLDCAHLPLRHPPQANCPVMQHVCFPPSQDIFPTTAPFSRPTPLPIALLSIHNSHPLFLNPLSIATAPSPPPKKKCFLQFSVHGPRRKSI